MTTPQQDAVIIKISRPNSETNKDGFIVIPATYDTYAEILLGITKTMNLKKRWYYSTDKRLPENYADTLIRVCIERDEPQDDVTFQFNGKYYEDIKQYYYQ